jgi:hypothetical protein
MKKISKTMRNMIEENKRDILSDKKTLSNIEKKVDTKIMKNGK